MIMEENMVEVFSKSGIWFVKMNGIEFVMGTYRNALKFLHIKGYLKSERV